MANKLYVLNAGYVELRRWMGGEDAILEGARICFQSEASNPKANEHLLKMLVREGHNSPLEHCTFTFAVKAPIFIFRQWHRHRIGMSYNELSLRYCEAKPEFFFPQCEGKAMYYIDMDSQYNIYKAWIEWFENHGESPARARELARPQLPLGLYSEMLWTCNGASLMHFLDLRYDRHAQFEMQEYAKAVLTLAKEVAPTVFGYKEELIQWQKFAQSYPKDK